MIRPDKKGRLVRPDIQCIRVGLTCLSLSVYQLTCEHCGKSFSRRSTLEQHVALHGAANTTDWEEIQDAALIDLEQAAAFGALAGELSYANFVDAFSSLARAALPGDRQGEKDDDDDDDEDEEEKELQSPSPDKKTIGSATPSERGSSSAGTPKPAAKGSDSQRRCPTCGKIFSRQSLLNRHLKLHAGIRPFLCNVSAVLDFSLTAFLSCLYIYLALSFLLH